VALKRKMGMLPPEEVHPPAAPVQARVEAVPAAAQGTREHDQEELAAALEELEAEQADEKRKAGR
jgi:phage shock protein A